jgi:aspartyl-tRNA(Asn)/glutamyl-tRNA(Gln) amidotransferase subunit A
MSDNAGSTDPADLGVIEAASLLRNRELSAGELVAACLRRISADGPPSADGSPDAINAFVRVYAEEAIDTARRIDDTQLSAHGVEQNGPPPPLCGVPIGLKDLYAVAGHPLTASSTLLHEVPNTDSEVWRRLRGAGMVLVGHTHTHEFAAGGTTDQVGNPHALERSAGGSSGGSAAALAARWIPAATGTDTAGSLRIPSAACGTAAIKPTRGLVPISGVIPLAPTMDHAGPMARSVRDCVALLAVMAGPDWEDATTGFGRWDGDADATGTTDLSGLRVAVSPRLADRPLDPDVAEQFAAVCDVARSGGATVLEVDGPSPTDEVPIDSLTLMTTDMLAWHRRFNERRDEYRHSTRQLLEIGESRALTGAQYVELQQRRRDTTLHWRRWLAEHDIDLIIEPTLPILAPVRGKGYDTARAEPDLVSLTAMWNWTGFPVVSFSSGLGRRSGLPTGVSLIGVPGGDRPLAEAGIALEELLQP